MGKRENPFLFESSTYTHQICENFEHRIRPDKSYMIEIKSTVPPGISFKAAKMNKIIVGSVNCGRRERILENF